MIRRAKNSGEKMRELKIGDAMGEMRAKKVGGCENEASDAAKKYVGKISKKYEFYNIMVLFEGQRIRFLKNATPNHVRIVKGYCISNFQSS